MMEKLDAALNNMSHGTGDRILLEVGRRLASVCDGTFLARLGGRPARWPQVVNSSFFDAARGFLPFLPLRN